MKKTPLSAQKCLSYNPEELSEAIKNLLKPLGGIEAFIKPGFRVLIKPNMLTCKTPERAATTHPALISAVATACVNAGAEVIIGDSPPAIFGRTEQFWETTGFAQAAKDSGARLICFENEPKAPISFKTNKRDVTAHIVKTFFMVDAVINLPKLKTHNLTRITGAIKNLFGLIPGFSKAQWHKIFPRAAEFSNFISDFAHQLPVTLNIMDGIEGMDGQGPAGGRVVKTGVLLASASPVAIDTAFCTLINVKPSEVHMLRRCHELNWGPKNIDEIEWLGEPAENIVIKDFCIPRVSPYDLIPEFILNLGRRLLWAGPALLPDTCIKCGRCKEICPAEAIEITDSGAKFDRNRCISCFCCM
ncbi:MAG: DUF362 domain-containing protein, partial [Erysipelotrichia bacterium]|nr:DUF362 domain-containing protein [Erysipelotrichia bacterium]